MADVAIVSEAEADCWAGADVVAEAEVGGVVWTADDSTSEEGAADDGAALGDGVGCALELGGSFVGCALDEGGCADDSGGADDWGGGEALGWVVD